MPPWVGVMFEFPPELIEYEIQRLSKKIVRWQAMDPAEAEDLEYVNQEIVLHVICPCSRMTLHRRIKERKFPLPALKEKGRNWWSIRALAIWRLKLDAECLVGVIHG